jgi:hypothetical protein
MKKKGKIKSIRIEHKEKDLKKTRRREKKFFGGKRW